MTTTVRKLKIAEAALRFYRAVQTLRAIMACHRWKPINYINSHDTRIDIFDTMAAVSTASNLPGPIALVGREKLVETVRTALETRSSNPRVLLLGTAGVGKTEFAISFVANEPYAYRFLVNGRSVETISADYQKLYESFYPVALTHTEQAAVSAVREWFASKSDWALIVDDLSSEVPLDRYLPHQATGHVLITTVDSIAGRSAAATRPIHIPPLSIEEGSEVLLDALSEWFGIENKPGVFDDETIAATRSICEFVGGLPLALEHASAMIRMSATPQDYLELLKARGTKAFEIGHVEGARHPNPVTKTLSLLLDRLKQPHSLALLQSASLLASAAIPEGVFANRDSWLAREQKGSDPRDGSAYLIARSELVRLSLIRFDTASKTILIHGLVRRFVVEELVPNALAEARSRVVATLVRSLPRIEYPTWGLCQSILPHAIQCEAYENEAEDEDISHLMEWMGSFYHEQARYDEALRRLKRCVARRDRQDRAVTDRTRIVRFKLAFVYHSLGQHRDAAAILAELLAEPLEPSGEALNLRIRCLDLLAESYRVRKLFRQAGTLYEQALELEAADEVPEPFRAESVLNHHAEFYKDIGNYEECREKLFRVFGRYRMCLSRHDPRLASVINDIGDLFRLMGDYARAERWHSFALGVRRRVLDPRNVWLANSMHDLAEVLRLQGKYAEAESLHLEALRIRQTALGESSPTVAVSLNNLAELYKEGGRYKEARRFLKQALEIRRNVFGPESFDFALSLHDLGDLDWREGDLGEAESKVRSAIVIQIQVASKNSAAVAQSLRTLGRILIAKGELADARNALEDALSIRTSLFGDAHPSVATVLHLIGKIDLEEHRLAEGIHRLERCVAILRIKLADDHLRVVDALRDLERARASAELEESRAFGLEEDH